MVSEKRPRYHVDRVSEVDDQIRGLVAKATTLAMRQSILDTLKSIMKDLANNPLGWGDPEFRTRKKGGLVCHGIRPPLVVHFVVFESERAVLILRIQAMPHPPLE